MKAKTFVDIFDTGKNKCYNVKWDRPKSTYVSQATIKDKISSVMGSV